MAEEIVDILAPPRFEPTGQTKTRNQAAEDGDWIGTFNIWLYSWDTEPMMLYQQRSLQKDWEPGKLDVSAGGHYAAGEQGLDGLRELKEELGIDILPSKVDMWGKKLHVSLDVAGRERRHVVSVFTAPFDGDLRDIELDPHELSGLFLVPARALLEIFIGKRTSLIVQGIDVSKKPTTYTVTADSFPYNPDNYHQRMAEYIALKSEGL
jgi:8-oxo-dGTP pyrophosphatase MutT (NUDIX family)